MLEHCCDTVTNLCYTSLAILFVHLQTVDREMLVQCWSLWDEFQIHNSKTKAKIKAFSSYLYKLRPFQLTAMSGGSNTPKDQLHLHHQGFIEELWWWRPGGSLKWCIEPYNTAVITKKLLLNSVTVTASRHIISWKLTCPFCFGCKEDRLFQWEGCTNPHVMSFERNYGTLIFSVIIFIHVKIILLLSYWLL